MKKTRVVKVEEKFCDFCGSPASESCTICGKDICPHHCYSLSIADGFNKRERFAMTIVSQFCPRHLQIELFEKVERFLKPEEKSEKMLNKIKNLFILPKG